MLSESAARAPRCEPSISGRPGDDQAMAMPRGSAAHGKDRLTGAANRPASGTAACPMWGKHQFRLRRRLQGVTGCERALEPVSQRVTTTAAAPWPARPRSTGATRSTAEDLRGRHRTNRCGLPAHPPMTQPGRHCDRAARRRPGTTSTGEHAESARGPACDQARPTDSAGPLGYLGPQSRERPCRPGPRAVAAAASPCLCLRDAGD